MFGLSLTDHLRLTFGHVIYSHRAHATTAAQHARWDRWLKTGEVLLMMGTAIAAVALVFTLNPAHAVATAIMASAAALTMIVRIALDFEHTSSTHRSCSARLWHIREQYRAVLSDLQDGVLTVEGARDRRDALMASLHHIYEDAPPSDRETYQSARQSLARLDEAVLSDEEIDQFLPPSLQKAGRSAPT